MLLPSFIFIHIYLHLYLLFLRRESMCNSNGSDQSFPFFIESFSKKSKASLSVLTAKKGRLRKRKVCFLSITKGAVRAGVEDREMEMENLKLYLENKFIMEENQRLRERALLLGLENSALLCHLITQKSQ